MLDNPATKEFAAEFFVLRTPLLPLREFLAFSEGLGFVSAHRNCLDSSAAAINDRELLRDRLLEFVGRPEVKEALWLSSPEFYEALSIWKKEPQSVKGQKVERTLYRYVARMSSRPTPFGLFAGCSLGKISAETRLEIGPRKEYRRRSRLDMEYLCNLAEKISADPVQQRDLQFRPNSSLYLAAGRYHHAQRQQTESVCYFQLVATEKTPYLEATLERATTGGTALQLASALVKDDPETGLDEALEYIGQLIESQVLVSDLVPAITDPDPVEGMIAQLERAEESSVAAGLRSVSERLRELDQRGLGNDLEGYQGIVNTVSQLPCEFKVEHLVQVDMMKSSHATLDQGLIPDILRGVEILQSLGASTPPDPFEQFKREFRERYLEQEIPLVLALDDDVGIGFERKEGPETAPETLIEDIDFSNDDEPTLRAHKTDLVLLRKLEELRGEKKTTLELDTGLLQALAAKNPLPLPDAFAVMGQLIGPADAKKDSSWFYLQGVTGPSGALLLGRFCFADCALADCVKEHIRAEEACRTGEKVVFAEVAHLLEGRVGNVICRPMLRAYEIPFLANSLAPRDHQIPITDLMVSIDDDRVRLRSQRLGCEVLPRLTSAHSYVDARSLKLYKFLCLLQSQGLAGNLAWDWGVLEEAAFLPRVTFGNTIFAPACWRMSKEAIEELLRADDADRLRRIEDWRTRRGIPRFVVLAEADNQILIDFENVLSTETLVEYVKNRESARLVETLGVPESLCASGPEGKFTHELVIPFVRKRGESQREEFRVTEENRANRAPMVAASDAERSFLPGSEWLFAKIYGSSSQIDRLLVDHIKPLMEKIMVAEAADRWFFVRYGDPHWHLRLRLHGNARNLNSEALPRLRDCLEPEQREGKIWRMQLDTYEREIERYGGTAGMGIAERLFQYDSELVLELLASIRDLMSTKIRWHLGFVAVDCLLSGLGLDLSALQQLVNDLGQSRQTNFSVSATQKKQLSEKFRHERQTLEDLLETKADSGDFPAPAQAALKRFAEQVKGIRADLEKAHEAGELSKSITELAGNYVHMHLNRLFRSAANAQELVLYDFLARTYDSKIAKEKR